MFAPPVARAQTKVAAAATDKAQVASIDALPLQTKMIVGSSDDPFEQEADREAKRVSGISAPSTTQNALHRKCSGCKEEDELQRCASEARVGENTAPDIVHEVLRLPGSPLDGSTRSFMETRFGHDFSEVRIHTNARAAESAASIGARAYTSGSNIAFGLGAFAPGTIAGRQLIAHELAHVIQQKGTQPAERKRVQRAPEGGAAAGRDRQLACVIRQGGCASSVDGGIPSADDITRHNKECAADTNYAGPDIFPTDEECKNPPKEPLSTVEKIVLGIFLLGAGAAVAATIVAGGIVLPIIIASVGEAAQAALAMYLVNAIAVNEIGLFAAGLVIACEGDVTGLVRALATDPVQAAQILAEVYILHVNISIANGPIKSATVPVRLEPPDEQLPGSNKIRFKTVGPPIFDEATETAGKPLGGRAAPSTGGEVSPAPSAAGTPAPEPSVVMDSATSTPKQICGPIKVGPAYRTFDEAFAAKPHDNAHIAEVILYSPKGEEIAHWWEVSESLNVRGSGRAGDTEQKALVRVKLQPGQTLEIRGAWAPCTVAGGCDIALHSVADQSGARIVYRTLTGAVHDYPKSDF